MTAAKQHDQYFNEDFAAGAVASPQLTIRRLLWRINSGHWPRERIGSYRERMEDLIEQLIKAELERHRIGEVTPDERSGRSVVHRRRRGQWRMIPGSD